ncbi:MAG: MltA domain-containing protein [Methylophilus sp.]|nr:MltA domain-containing protein [Methylophilus sp.]
MHKIILCIIIVLLNAGCSARNIKSEQGKQVCPPTPPTASTTLPSTQIPDKEPPSVEKPVAPSEYSLLKPANWEALDGFLQDDLSASWNAWLTSCNTLKNKTEWQNACNFASKLNKPNTAQIAEYFTTYFDVYSTSNLNGSNTGLITGYYEPVLKGSRKSSVKYPYPLYQQPKDLITVDLSTLFPELKYKRVRGKLEGNKLVPYLTRAEIESESQPLKGNEIVWINDALDAFYLQIQGSGLIQLDSGEQLHLGYADQNGHTYQSIGKLLVQRGELSLSQASMQGIKDWAKSHTNQLRELLNSNPSYVFFKELPSGLFGPLGALGVPLTAERSVAIDPKYIPLGAPIFLSTSYPNDNKPLKRLMIAQDTGGAIKDGVRADFFWGSGDAAGKMAGAMKQAGQIWVLLPKEFKLNNSSSN